MPSGLQVFSPTGVLYTDMSWYISQRQGEIVTNAANGSITMPPLPAGKERWYTVVPIVDTNGWRGKRPGVTVSGNTLSWSYSHSTWFGQFSANCRITYGYF